MAMIRIGGPGIGLTNPLNYPTAPSGQAFTPVKSNAITLQGGEMFNLPAGTYLITPGNVTYLQFLNPVTSQWATYDTSAQKTVFINSDGGNYRLVNLTGCPIGTLITNAGSGYTNGVGSTATGLTVTASAGSSTWVPIVGGAVSATAVSAAAGSNYTFAPNVIVDAPPGGGFPATATCTISGNGVNAVTITNQGAGYSTAPNLTFVNDQRDTTGTGASWTTTLTGSGTLTGLYPSNNGTALTATPTFTFAPASSTAATAIMNYAVTGYTVSTAGSTYTAPVMLASAANTVSGTSILTNPAYTTGLTLPRPARIKAAVSGAAITATGLVVEDPGNGIQTIPTATIATAATPLLAASAVVVVTVGGVNDTVTVQPI